MDNNIHFDYYYGNEAEQFLFYRIPRILIKDGMLGKYMDTISHSMTLHNKKIVYFNSHIWGL